MSQFSATPALFQLQVKNGQIVSSSKLSASVLTLVMVCLFAALNLRAQTVIAIPAASGGGIQSALPTGTNGHVFGVNLDDGSLYLNGQMSANLLAAAAGSFQPQMWNMASTCMSGTTSTWVDTNQWSPQPANFWQGATYQVVYGADTGETGTITSSDPASGSNGITLHGTWGTGCSNGDLMIVRCTSALSTCAGGYTPAAATAGGYFGVSSTANASFETTDLSPSSTAPQALKMVAPNQLNIQADQPALGNVWINLNGTYTLSFRAKGTAGTPTIAYQVFRIGGTYFTTGTVTPTVNATAGAGWTNYTATFTASETGSQVTQGVNVTLTVAGGTVIVQDLALTEAGTGGNTTAFRNAYYQRLQALNPGILRFMTGTVWGCTVENVMLPYESRAMCGASTWGQYGGVVDYGLPEFLNLAKAVGADPWWTFSGYATPADMANLAAYLSGTCGNGNAYTTIRCNEGQTIPWTSVFNHIYLEMGNEIWNGPNGENLYANQGLVYGGLVGTNTAALRASSFYNPKMKMVASGFVLESDGNGGWNQNVLTAASGVSNGSPDYIDGAPYIFNILTDTSSNAKIFGPMYAEASNYNSISTGAGGTGYTYFLQHYSNANYGVQGAVYETNLGTQCGLAGITQSTINGVVAGVGAGLDATLNMLLGVRDAGVLVQNAFALPEDANAFYTATSTTAGSCGTSSSLKSPLWGINRAMPGPTNASVVDRPSGIALNMVNAAMLPNLLAVTQTGTPTYSSPAAQPNPGWTTLTNNIVANPAVPYVQSFGFGDGAGNYSLIVYNLNLTSTEAITFTGAAAPTGSVTKTLFTSANITDNNESATISSGTPPLVQPTPTTVSNPGGDVLPPFSMTTYTWSTSGGSGAPTLSIASISNQTYGVAPFTVSSTSNSSGAITYSVVSGPATVSGSTVTITGVGTVTLQASQAASGGYTAGTATTSFTVSAATPTLAFAAIPTETYGVAPFAVSATSNSTGAITYSVVSGPATISGSSVTITGIGTITLQASQAASGNYTTATATASFTVNGETPTLTIASIPNQTYGAPPFAVSATSNSPGAISYSGITGPATISGNTVTITGIGTVTVVATQAASGNYLTGVASASFTVGAATPNLTFSAIPTQSSGAAPFTVSATSASQGAITYSVVSGPASIAGSTVTITGTGTVTLLASQAAAGNYTAATATTTFNVTGNAPTLNLVGLQNRPYSPALFQIAATSNSPGAITYSILSGPASIAGSVVSLTGLGTVTVQASQAASGSYSSAQTSGSFIVSAGTPGLRFVAIPTQMFGIPPFTVAATSNSTGAITYSILGGPATISGNTVTLTGAGNVILMASQVASADYTAATATTYVSVGLGTPTLSFVSIPTQTFGAAPFPVTAISDSTGAITYSVVSGPASISGSTVTLTGTGTVVLQASMAASRCYAAATTTTSFTVTGAGATSLVFGAIASQTYGATPFPVSATSNSPGAITYSVVSGPASIAGNTVTLTGAGVVTLQASQVASGSYNAATVTTSFNVSPATPALSFAAIASQTYGAAPFTVAASSASPGAITYSVVSGPASISGATVTLTSAGTVTLLASQAATSNYTVATATISFNVSAVTPALSFSAIPTQTYGATPFAVAASSVSPGAITYSVVSGPASIAGSTVTLTGAGTVILLASQAATGGYTLATATTSFTVNAATPTLTIGSIANQIYGAPSFYLSATTNSPAFVWFTVVSGPATLVGNYLTLTGTGMVTVQANQAATGGYTAATSATSFNVTGTTPSLSFVALPGRPYSPLPFLVAATSNSPGTITYSVVSGPATVAGSAVTLTGTGPVVLLASQAAAGGYTSATATGSFTVFPANPGLSFIAIPAQIFGVAPFTVSATSNSTGTITYSVASGPATMSGSTITLTGAGTVILVASQVAAGNYTSGMASTSFAVSLPVVESIAKPAHTSVAPAETTESTAPAVQTSTRADVANTSSGASNPAAVTGASQAAETSSPAVVATPSAAYSETLMTPTLRLTKVPSQVYGAGSYPLSATSDSAGAVTYSIVSGPAILLGNSVRPTGVGTVTVKASQAAYGAYLATTTTTSFEVIGSSLAAAQGR